MSRVSHDSSWKQCHGVTNAPSNDKFQKNFIGEKVRTQQELEEYVLKEKLKNKSVYVQIREDFVEKEECDRDEDSKINIINVQKRNDFERREEENVYRKLKNKIKNVKRNGSDVKEKTKSNNVYVKISKEFPETDKNNVDKELKINDDVKNYITKEITSNKSDNIINRDVTNETQATKNDEKLKKCVIFLEELDTNYKINHEKNELVKEINSTNTENVSKYKYINKTKWDAVDKYEKTLSSFVSGRVKTYLKPRHKKIQKAICMKTFNSNALRTNDINARSKWNLNSGVLISLIVLYVSGPSYAQDTTSFSSGLTSRMIASFLGYPSTCTLGTEVRPCSLTLSCWLRGGTRLRGCGGWLFSCCGPPEPSDTLSNSIPSSDWKYKPSPPVLRQVPQRNVMPNNVFRRRVDDDATQMDCGLPSSRILQKRIIGGREARFAEFPWQAHVRISEFQCGGVLVSRRYVATAAHCVSRAHTRDIAVWLGAIDTSATHHPARKLGVVQKILHPLFQFRMTQPDRYDIALLKLSRVITYMSHILPICLPDYDMDLRGRSGVIAGWGKTDASNGHTGTNLLRSATVPILSKEQCINWHQSKQISVEIHSEMICAGHSDGHQDACLGDSGGPLIVLDNGRYYLVGITSAGFGCGVDHQPGIYHNVKLTANWIRSVITPSVNYNDNYLK